MRNLVLLGATLILFATGCSRASDTSKLAIALPPSTIPSPHSKAHAKGISAFGNATLTHVIINITGAGMTAPVLFTWDARDAAAATTSFEVTAPKGADRLIQVLGVYQDDSSGSMVFYYGDLKKTLSAANETADVSITALGGALPTLSGQIMGRYLTSADAGPTGMLNVKYLPAAGKPEMLIEQSVMLSGWFSVFGLSSVALRYEVNGETLFGGPVTLNSATLDPNADSGAEFTRRVKAAIPVSIRKEGGSNQYRPEEAQYLVWGFWGNAAAKSAATWTARSVCKISVEGYLSNLTQFDSTPANWGNGDPLQVTNLGNIGDPLPSETTLLNQISPSSTFSLLGGYDGVCGAPPDEYSTWLRVTKSQFDGNGKDNAAGFRGPLRLADPIYNQYLSMSFSGNRTISGSVLPGIPAVIKGFRVFKKVGVTNDYRLEKPDCAALPTGYVAAGSGNINTVITAGTGTTGVGVGGIPTFTINSTISDADAAAKTAAVICSVRPDDTLYGPGMFIGSYAFPASQSGGASIVQNPAVAWKVNVVGNTTGQIYNNTCIPVDIVAVDASGQPGRVNSNVTLNLFADSGSAGNGFSYYDDCSYSVGSIYSPGTTSFARLWYKSDNVGTGTTNLSVSSSGMPSYGSTSLSYADQGTTAANSIRFFNNPVGSINAYQCYPLFMQSVINGENKAANPNYGGPSSSTLSSTTGNTKFYSDPMCTGTDSPNFSVSGPYSSQRSTVFKYFRYESSTSANETINTAGNWGGTFTSQPLSFTATNIVQPGSPAIIKLDAPDTIPYGCNEYTLSIVDSNGRLSPPPSGMFTINFSGGANIAVYNYSGCYSGGTNMVDFFADGKTTQKKVYLKGLMAGTTSLTASGGGLNMSRTMTVNPEPVSMFMMLMPGNYFTPGYNYPQGPTLPLFAGKTYNISVLAITQSGNLGTSFTAPSTDSLALAGSTPFTITSPPKGFLTADAGSISIQLTPAVPWGYFQFYGYNFMKSWGLMPASSPSMYIYDLPNINSTVVRFGGNDQISTANCTPNLFQTRFDTVPIQEAAYDSYTPTYNAIQNANSQPATIASFANATGVGFYSDESCTTAITPGGPLVPNNDSAALVYLKAVSGSGSATVNVNISNGYTASLPMTLTYGSSSAGTHTSYEFYGSVNGIEDNCQSLALVALDGSGNSVAAAPATSVALSMSVSPPATGAFYTDATCFTLLPAQTLNMSNSRAKKVYYKVSNLKGIPFMNLTLTASDGTLTGTLGGHVLNTTPD